MTAGVERSRCRGTAEEERSMAGGTSRAHGMLAVASQDGTHVVRRGRTNVAPPSTARSRQQAHSIRGLAGDGSSHFADGETRGQPQAASGQQQQHQAKGEIAASSLRNLPWSEQPCLQPKRTWLQCSPSADRPSSGSIAGLAPFLDTGKAHYV